MLRTIDEIVELLGGTVKVAALCGVGRSAVSNWRLRGRIPAEFFLVFSEALRAVGADADPALFGMAAAVEART